VPLGGASPCAPTAPVQDPRCDVADSTRREVATLGFREPLADFTPENFEFALRTFALVAEKA
jgi:hypothetical protein